MTRIARRFWILCCATLWIGCDQTIEQQLDGRWQGVELEVTGENISAASEGWALGTSLHFSGLHLDITVPGQPPQHGSFRVLKNEDGDLQLELRSEKGKTRETHLTLETPSLLRWHINSQNTVVLRRR